MALVTNFILIINYNYFNTKMNSHDLAVIIYYHKFIRTNRKIFSKFNRTSEKRSFENQKDHLENKRKKKTKTWNITRTYELAQLWPSGTKQNRGG